MMTREASGENSSYKKCALRSLKKTKKKRLRVSEQSGNIDNEEAIVTFTRVTFAAEGFRLRAFN